MLISKYSFGIGDRFGHQGKAQLSALNKVRKAGINVVPVWNKSNREHGIVGTSPEDVRAEADASVKSLATSPKRRTFSVRSSGSYIIRSY